MGVSIARKSLPEAFLSLIKVSTIYLLICLPFLAVLNWVSAPSLGSPELFSSDQNAMITFFQMLAQAFFLSMAIVFPLRLSPMLVSASMNVRISCKEAWQATRPFSRAMFDIAFYGFLVHLGLFALSSAALAPGWLYSFEKNVLIIAAIVLGYFWSGLFWLLLIILSGVITKICIEEGHLSQS